MCHFMLPTRAKPNVKGLDGRYADEAMLLFRREIKAVRSNHKEFKAKIFGGGNMFQTPSRCLKKSNCQNVACRNVMTAKELLRLHGIDIAAEHVGDSGHRNVVFDVWSGDVWLRHVKNAALLRKARDEESNSGVHC
jgi:chemotaxis protein CheD